MRILTLVLLIGCGDKDVDDTAGATDSEPAEIDADGDGFTEVDDCDDQNAAISPNAVEICDGVDNECDGMVDADDDSLADGVSIFADADGDGFGAGDAAAGCVGEGWSGVDSDCDDSRADISPDAAEVCDADDVDEDCDGDADDADDSVDPDSWQTFYIDGDGDGYGDPDLPTSRCDAASGAVTDNTDCNDEVAAANPADGCWSGDWIGTLAASVDAGSFGTDICFGTINALIDMTDTPMFSGAGGCTTVMLGDLTVEIDGNIDGTDQIIGTFDVGGVVTDKWTGTITESGLTGFATGSGNLSGVSFTYEFDLNLRRD
ncbi:MAG: hypothetical protein ACI8RZ_001204 [Myxococcota bacterium]|jgi:hypothetical protein